MGQVPVGVSDDEWALGLGGAEWASGEKGTCVSGRHGRGKSREKSCEESLKRPANVAEAEGREGLESA